MLTTMEEQSYHVPSPILQLTSTNRQRLTITFLCFYFATTLYIIFQENVLCPASQQVTSSLLSFLISGAFVSTRTIKLHGMATEEWERGLDGGDDFRLSGASVAVAFWIRRRIGFEMRSALTEIGEVGSGRSELQLDGS